MSLPVVASCYAKFETGQTFSNVQTDSTTPNNVGSCWSKMLRPFPRSCNRAVTAKKWTKVKSVLQVQPIAFVTLSLPSTLSAALSLMLSFKESFKETGWKGLINQVLTYFDRIQVYRTHADIGLSKRSKNNPSEKERFNIAKTGGARMTGEKYRLGIKTKKNCHLMYNVVLLKESLSETAKNLNCRNYPCKVVCLPQWLACFYQFPLSSWKSFNDILERQRNFEWRVYFLKCVVTIATVGGLKSWRFRLYPGPQSPDSLRTAAALPVNRLLKT